MRRRREQDEIPWYVWLAVAVDPLTAAYVLAARIPSASPAAAAARRSPAPSWGVPAIGSIEP
jgi:hypothetical protein